MWKEAKQLPIPQLGADNFGELVSLYAYHIVSSDDIAEAADEIPGTDVMSTQQKNLLETLYLVITNSEISYTGQVLIQYIFRQVNQALSL